MPPRVTKTAAAKKPGAAKTGSRKPRAAAKPQDTPEPASAELPAEDAANAAVLAGVTRTPADRAAGSAVDTSRGRHVPGCGYFFGAPGHLFTCEKPT